MKDFKRLNEMLMADVKNHLLRWCPDGKFEGNEFTALNPTRPDQTKGSFRFNISTGLWSDYSTGDKSNDLISYYAYINGIKPGEAYDQLLDSVGMIDQSVKPRKATKKEVIEIDYDTEPKPIPKKDYDHLYDYNGRFCVMRWDAKEDGKKIFKQLTWTKKGWLQKAPTAKRPLFMRYAGKSKTVVVVEGEKCVLALAKIGIPAICWSGGSNAWEKTDFEPISDMNLICWPDNDEAGIKAIHAVIEHLGKQETAKIIAPQGTEKGYDAADFIRDGASLQSIMDLLKSAVMFNEYFSPKDDECPDYINDNDEQDYYESDLEDSRPIQSDVIDDIKPWIALGYNKGVYYYYSRLTKQIVELTPGMHTEACFLQFADLNFWAEYFPGSKKVPINWGGAREFMMIEASKKGVFNPDLVRGPGCWEDDGRIIVHQGDSIRYGESIINLSDFKSRYVYEAGLRINGFDAVKPASVQDAKILANILDEFCWANSMHGKYAAGWIVVSIIGGALQWRPHLYVTGKSGIGKTYIMEQVVLKILGMSCIPMKGNSTTAAGARQISGNSSRSLFIDEFENETGKDIERNSETLQLIRTASSRSEAKIVKGGKNGVSISYSMNLCCILSSINVGIDKKADATRFTLITLAGQLTGDEFSDVNKCVVETITEEYGASIRSRAISMAPIIIENAKTFSKACAIRLGARLGDQIGTIMAGYYSLHSDKMITYEAAYNWVNKQDWGEFDEIKNQSEDVDFMDYLVGLQIVCDNGKRRSVSELINIVSTNESNYDFESNESINKKEAKDVLGRHGIAVSAGRGDVPEGWIAIASRHSELSKLLRGTAWEVGWKHQLMRVEGVISAKSWGFAGKITNCLIVPNKFTKVKSL